MIRDNGESLARSSVIAVDELSKERIKVREQMDKFSKNLESKIGNNLIPTFEVAHPGKIYYTPFGTTVKEDW